MIASIAALLLLAIAVFLIRHPSGGGVLSSARDAAATIGASLFGKSSNESAGESPDELSDTLTESPLSTEGLATYDHEEPFFAFAYPKELTVTELTEENGNEAVVLEGGEKQGFQIRFFSFDEEGPLTVERIREDIPDVVIDDPQAALITAARLPALLFWSQDSVLGKTRELWFIHDGYFYQLTTFPEFDTTLAGIMERWTF